MLFDSKGAKVILRGKTVERVTRVIAYVSLSNGYQYILLRMTPMLTYGYQKQQTINGSL